jgi:predicted NBD/HSP70 family sugar kinase
MDESKQVFIGTDCGATMSKVGAVWADGTTVSTKLLQRPTNAVQGRDAVVAGWIEAIGEYLAQNSLEWAQVSSVGLAIPGPYLRYGVLGHSANMPASFEGWDFNSDYSRALA